jgi:hypothetical protein
MSITIVTSFISNINNYRNIKQYVEYGKQLLNCTINKIVFIEKEIYDLYLKDYIFSNTYFVFVKKEQNYLYNYIEQITDLEIITDNPSKDNIHYFFIMCHKTEWMKIAITLNIFHSTQYVWIDFGISHIFQNNTQLFQDSIHGLRDKFYNNVRIATGTSINNIIHLDIENNNDFLKNVSWNFLGGIFGGKKEKLLEFSHRMRDKCIYFISNKKTFSWEVNIWCYIYKDNPLLFDCYYADHNSSMIQLY